MEARLISKPVHDVIPAIQALDLEPVKERIMDRELGKGWTREYADRIGTAYKTYLMMLVKYPSEAEDIMLAKDVDEFWHTHILQTMKYVADCMQVFGNYLHHAPHVGERSPEDLRKREANAEKTRRLYEMEFGSEQAAGAAWSGNGSLTEQAAYSAVSLPGRGLAYSAAAIRTAGAAYSAAQVAEDQLDTRRSEIRSDAAAYSAAQIAGPYAAYSAATIDEKSAAYSAATIDPTAASYSAARVTADSAAYSAASIDATRSAYSAVSVSSGNPQS